MQQTSKIECLHCQEVLVIPEFIDIKSYDGEIVCQNCGARLAIKFAGSPKPVKYKLVKEPPKGKLPVTIKFVPASEPEEKST